MVKLKKKHWKFISYALIGAGFGLLLVGANTFLYTNPVLFINFGNVLSFKINDSLIGLILFFIGVVIFAYKN